MQSTIYEAAGGQQAILALAEAWHRRCLDDPVVSHAFSHPGQHPHHVTRLAAYWAEALGGPTTFTDEISDQSAVLRMHAGNGVHEEMDRRAEACFALALDDAALPSDDRLRTTLKEWFGWSVSDMATHPGSAAEVPPGLPVPRWSWEGPVTDS
jgi:hemoglobin